MVSYDSFTPTHHNMRMDNSMSHGLRPIIRAVGNKILPTVAVGDIDDSHTREDNYTNRHIETHS